MMECIAKVGGVVFENAFELDINEVIIWIQDQNPGWTVEYVGGSVYAINLNDERKIEPRHVRMFSIQYATRIGEMIRRCEFSSEFGVTRIGPKCVQVSNKSIVNVLGMLKSEGRFFE